VLQEVLDLHIDEEDAAPEDTEDTVMEPTVSEQVFVMLSVATVLGGESVNTMKFHGCIQGVEVLILVDSESSHSFLSTVADQLSGITPMTTPVQVQVADGADCLVLVNYWARIGRCSGVPLPLIFVFWPYLLMV
jgi:hypothetical protein